jgi:FdhD protein
MSGARVRRVVAFSALERRERDDEIAHEEPLEIQLMGAAIAVVMRTPGHDEELGLGFLATERVITSASDVASIRHCSSVADPEAEENVLRIVLRDGIEAPIERLKRSLYASSSCGVCGKATIEIALATGGPIPAGAVRVTPDVLYGLPPVLRGAQRTFEATGGLHAAGLFTPLGELVLVREDVGRHNAVDKVVGAQLLSGAGVGEMILLVSGRVSFEIVQKAAAVGIPIVAGISATTSLAVRYAEALGVTLVGFLRGEKMNVYSHPERIGPL